VTLSDSPIWDLVVVGAGPAGSSAARVVAERGFRCLILERGTAPGERVVCGGGAPPALVGRLGIESITDRMIDRARLTCGSDEILFRSGRPIFAALQRRLLDAELARRAVAAGAELWTGTLVLQLEREKLWKIEVDRSGAREELRGRAVVFADGCPTLAFRQLGIGFDHRTQWCAQAVRYRLRPEGHHPGDRFDFAVDPGGLGFGYFWIFPKEGYLNVGAGTLREPGRAIDLDAQIRRLGAAAGIDWTKTELLSRRCGLVPLEMARRWATDGGIVVGDAAGAVNAMTGGGLLYAVISGEMGGRTLAGALKADDLRGERLERHELRFRLSPWGLWLRAMTGLTKGTRALERIHPGSLHLLYRNFYFPLMKILGRIPKI
jgi:geranylgeranyl reductase family protein